ncbi:hypothetical protein [Spirosoma sp. KNUC1025]|uniref:hypothetical protein n=1 Tax=Spirosoma sp. KNUC1025 TaxID=2894082 RepID=UPI003868EDD5|nr:hypothetical protein LN737_19115 [Spirosoma sp. KNUC1025]
MENSFTANALKQLLCTVDTSPALPDYPLNEIREKVRSLWSKALDKELTHNPHNPDDHSRNAPSARFH